MTAIKLSVKNQTRVVPIRFERASKLAPDINCPVIDTQGFNIGVPAVDGLPECTPLGSAALSTAENSTVKVKLVRESISASAALFVTSSNTDIVRIMMPHANTKCADGTSSVIQFKTATCHEIDGSSRRAKSAVLEVRFGGYDGPIISTLKIYVFPELIVKIQTYLVTINDESGQSGKTPTINIDAVVEMTKAIWHHSGISLSFAQPISLSSNLHQANLLGCHVQRNEMNSLTQLKWEADRINLYIVEELEGAFCHSINAQEYKFLGLSRPGIFLGLSRKGVHYASDAHLCANELAHALGKFFSLSEINTEDKRTDSWSMMSLMYGENTINRGKPPTDSWQDYHDAGFGQRDPNSACRGAFIPLKSFKLSQHDASGNSESQPKISHQSGASLSSPSIKARQYISTGAMHLYS